MSVMLHEKCWLINFGECGPKQALYKSMVSLTYPQCLPAEAPAVKAAPKRRRGGKHRHKGSTTDAAGEAGVSGPEDSGGAGAAAEGTVAHAALSDNLARLQLDRLASNAAAGGLMPLLLRPLLLIQLLLSPCCCCCCFCSRCFLDRTSASVPTFARCLEHPCTHQATKSALRQGTLCFLIAGCIIKLPCLPRLFTTQPQASVR